MAGRAWDASYQDGPAPWEIVGPQPAVVELAARGVFGGAVLDAGCGSGENTLHIAALGVPVLGVDVAATAIDAARQKALERGVEAEFAVADALHLERLGRAFDTILDSGLFHTFDTGERAAYAGSLARAAKPGTMLYVVSFSDEGPEPVPHAVSQDDVRTAFSQGWTTVSIEPCRLETRIHDNGAPAWLSTIRRS
nr:class I SAM-dependent methyltransferase [Kribbella shirazensis]